MIFIIMEFSLSSYEKLVNFLIPRKFDMINSVVVNKLGHKMGTFHGDFTIKLNPKVKKILSDDCYNKLVNGETLTFWSMALCSKRKIDLIGLERELEKTFKELTGIKLPGVGVIKTNYIL
jgi:hypothetical protein